MAMRFFELDDVTRGCMLGEFEAEEATNPYRSSRMSQWGISALPALMREAIQRGNDATLSAALMSGLYWNEQEPYTRNGVTRYRSINLQQTAEMVGLTEFNTWYVRGLSGRLQSEGIEKCEVYRGAQPKHSFAPCSCMEGQVFSVKAVYDGHRAKYWPAPGNPDAFSIPFGFSCHHTIKRK